MTDRIKWLEKIKKQTEENRIVIVQGLRRTGKTTILKDIMQSVKDSKEYEVIWHEFGLFGNNDSEWALEQINKFKLDKSRKYFMFLDEFQDFEEWDKFFKTIFDVFENVKILSTGSTSHNTTATNKTEGGRYKVIKMNTLSYLEYDKILRVNTLFDNKLDILSNYVTTGSYPLPAWHENINVYRSSVNENVLEKIKSSNLLAKSNLSSYVYVDAVLKHIIVNLGSTMSASSLSKELGLNKVTCQKALDYLKNSYIISQVNSFHKQQGKATMWETKFYLEDQSFFIMNSKVLTFAELLKSEYEQDRTYASFIFENVVYNHLRNQEEYFENELSSSIHFLKAKGQDIDFVFTVGNKNHYIDAKLSHNTDCLSKQQKEFATTEKLNIVYFGDSCEIANVKYISIYDLLNETIKINDLY